MTAVVIVSGLFSAFFAVLAVQDARAYWSAGWRQRAEGVVTAVRVLL